MRRRRVQAREIEPSVSIVVAAHNESDVIERRIRNLLELDYPADLVEVVVASDASTDGTDEAVERLAAEDERVKLVRCERGGKVAAQNRGVAESSGEIARSRCECALGTRCAPEAGAQLRRPGRRVCDGSRFVRSPGWDESRRGLLALRAVAACAGIPTRIDHWRQWAHLRRAPVGLGRPRALVRHDLGLPYLMVQRPARGLRPEAVSIEKPSRDIEDEYRRKVRMLRGAWVHVSRDAPARRACVFRRARLAPAPEVRKRDPSTLRCSSRARFSSVKVYAAALEGQLLWLVLALAGRFRIPIPGAGLAYYYLVVTWATIAGLARYVRFGPPLLWERIEGTR